MAVVTAAAAAAAVVVHACMTSSTKWFDEYFVVYLLFVIRISIIKFECARETALHVRRNRTQRARASEEKGERAIHLISCWFNGSSVCVCVL